ncbi:hypothetical protein VMCG_02006 [Cytospora schulzeri]|uniref:Protein kinase domain-containing protein n=1 Tax=Cytospora schulzeri TaxID=448051 RepID=A0A423X397_9PEZI|nr:hypothetical protein VMCG_02006 [Valsa malicola]
MEYCDHGDLKNYLQRWKTLTEKETQEVTLQILGGLSLMHEAGFAHRDVKPANIFIKRAPPEHWWVKLGDLGLSKRAEAIVGSTSVRGTPGFMAPEILGLNGEDPKTANAFSVDIWCLGETVYQALTGHGTFDYLGKLLGYVNGSIEFPQMALEKAEVSDSGIDFVRALMVSIPSQRLSVRQALDQPWMLFGEEAKFDTADGSFREETRFEQLDLEGSDEIGQASGEWTTEIVANAVGDHGSGSSETSTSSEHTFGHRDRSVDRTMKRSSIPLEIWPSKPDDVAHWIDTSRLVETRYRTMAAEDDNNSVDFDNDSESASGRDDIRTYIEDSDSSMDMKEVDDDHDPHWPLGPWSAELDLGAVPPDAVSRTTTPTYEAAGHSETEGPRCKAKSRLYPVLNVTNNELAAPADTLLCHCFQVAEEAEMAGHELSLFIKHEKKDGSSGDIFASIAARSANFLGFTNNSSEPYSLRLPGDPDFDATQLDSLHIRVMDTYGQMPGMPPLSSLNDEARHLLPSLRSLPPLECTTYDPWVRRALSVCELTEETKMDQTER